MIQNEEKKTSVKMRIIIIAIAIFMLGSTFALYAGIVLNYSSPDSASSKAAKEARFEELYNEYRNKLDAQAAELSAVYYPAFLPYKSRVKAFNAASVTQLKVEDLAIGSGRELTSMEDVDYAAYYIGWLSDETVFDSSFDNFTSPTALINPLGGTTSMIQGWLEGITRTTDDDGNLMWEGMRIGGVREITIPAALAYGSTEQGVIPADSPLKFVVMLVDRPEDVEIPEELMKLNQELYGA